MPVVFPMFFLLLAPIAVHAQPQHTADGPRLTRAEMKRSIQPAPGRMVIRGGVGIYYNQPVTNVVTPSGSNPPFSASVNNTSNANLASAFAVPPGGSSPIQAIDPNFKSGADRSNPFTGKR